MCKIVKTCGGGGGNEIALCLSMFNDTESGVSWIESVMWMCELNYTQQKMVRILLKLTLICTKAMHVIVFIS